MIIKEIVWSHLGTFPVEKFYSGFGEKAAIFSRQISMFSEVIHTGKDSQGLLADTGQYQRFSFEMTIQPL